MLGERVTPLEGVGAVLVVGGVLVAVLVCLTFPLPPVTRLGVARTGTTSGENPMPGTIALPSGGAAIREPPRDARGGNHGGG